MFTKKNILSTYAAISAIIAFSAIYPDDSKGWTQMNDGLTNQQVNTLISMDKVLYVGISNEENLGGFFKAKNNERWQIIGLLNNVPLLAYSANSVLYVVNYEQLIYRTSNMGVDWEVLESPSFCDIQTLCSINNRLFAGTYDEGVFKSTDRGNTWTHFGLKDKNILFLHSTNLEGGGTLYAGTQSGEAFRFNNDTGNWLSINEGLPGNVSIEALTSIYDDEVYAGTWGKGVFMLNQFFWPVWLEINEGLEDKYVTTLYTMYETLYAGTKDGGVFEIIHDEEADWQYIGLAGQEISALCSVNDVLYAGTYGGGVFKKIVRSSWWSNNWQTVIGVSASVAGLTSGILGTYFSLKKCLHNNKGLEEAHQPLMDNQEIEMDAEKAFSTPMDSQQLSTASTDGKISTV